MLHKKETVQRLCELLLAIALEESIIESYRQSLCELPEFVPYAAFKRLDRGDKGFVTQQDLMRFLHSNGFWNRQNFDESHCAALIQNFDSDEMPGTLKYQNFLLMCLPRDAPQLRQEVVGSRLSYNVCADEYLPYQIEYALSLLIEREIEFCLKLETQKILLDAQLDYGVEEAFVKICSAGVSANRTDQYDQSATRSADSGRLQSAAGAKKVHQAIDYVTLEQYLLQEGYEITAEQVNAVLRRGDRDQDGSKHQRLGSLNMDISAKNLLLSPKRLRTALSPQSKKFSMNRPVKIGQQKQVQSYQNLQNFAKLGTRSDLKRTPQPKKLPEGVKNENQLPSTHQQLVSSAAKKISLKSLNTVQKKSPTKIQQSHTEERTVKKLQRNDQFTPKQQLAQLLSTQNMQNQKILLAALKELVKQEREVEQCRQDLSLCADFNYEECFWSIFGGGKINLHRFEDKLASELRLFFEESVFFLFSLAIDPLHTGHITFQQFLSFLLPKQKEYLLFSEGNRYCSGSSEKNISKYKKRFAPQTRTVFERLIELLFESLALAEEQRQKLAVLEKFDLEEQFSFLAGEQETQCTEINLYKIKRIAGAHFISFLDSDLPFLQRVLDQDQDGHITYADFAQALVPKATTIANKITTNYLE